ncbi:uncharacterized protein C11orf24 homolog [Pristis pectinata]|uniref:uncharacterized protein C11orf24 homolog n=1 Tax=Pristis pectinata TaxID=685728 RepID=UPI00223E1FFF|nr:uncharacterized protein C11orf24 homolog [Pristis pectinata]XP_051884848.1 uncharacterized protein C11orf24 homolog [Pristis pectinata]XP_051884849.1 uncharacterized protein C11orf24 homolog [Pristis pectinata]XP_051884850.1 uncharacterized protein C11orf24 homolog [Pristis pectinata]XP_051884851.1 uncharacterized protein C11orf24 homolog [Pristis pectinata]XP_051884852.1 uncharacterized protein C11orf24 homolog [Pristis pectinata]XP_051884853.1 uncharacterized protein C11orf24 homolog [Pr
MWTLGLFLYVSISFLTKTSMQNLQDNGIKVLKLLRVSSAEECNQTCDSVTDQGGLECNWVVIEENQNLCFHLYCLDISICKGATVEDVKALQIGEGSPVKNLHPVQKEVRDTHSVYSSASTFNMLSSDSNTSMSATVSTAVTNSSTESNEVSSTDTINATATASTPSKQFIGTSGSISSTSATLPALTMVTATSPTSNSKMITTEVTSITTASTKVSKQHTTVNLTGLSTTHESTASIVHSQQTTSVPANSSKIVSTMAPNSISKDSTTSLQSNPISTKLLSSTPKTTQSSTSQLTTVTPTKVSTTKLILETTTRQKQTRTDASTITGGVSQSPKIKSRTTVAFNDEKNYVFPSVPAGALIKYLADTSSLMAILIFGLLFFLVSIILFAHKAFESYKRKDYVQVDYLINGMYADSDM